MCRFLVTGGAGFIGHHLVRALVARGHAVRVLDDLSTGRPAALPSDDRVELLVGDVLDPQAVARAARDVDMVLHLAALVGMRQAHANARHSFRVSDEGTANLLWATGDVPVLLMSSSAVYGLRLSALASEAAAPSWDDVLAYDGGSPGYACGKYRLEEHGREAMSRGRRVMLLRPFNVVGPGQVGTYGMVLPSFVDRARAGEPLPVHGDGGQTRSFGDVGTFVDCTLRLLALSEAWHPRHNPINIGTTTETTIRALAELVNRETGSRSGVTFVPYESIYPGKRDVRARRPDIGRLESLLGPVRWKPLEEIVRELVADR